MLASAIALVSCNPTPQELAEKNISLHEELARCATEADSLAVFRKISEVESKARDIFNKTELKEYERLAHPAQD